MDTDRSPASPPTDAPILTVDDLRALVDATREIAEVLDIELVLQMIVDRLRGLIGSHYAALGIADERGMMERFVTSGISRADRAAIGDLPRGHGLLGLIIREGRSYLIPDIAAHADSYGFPPNHPPMRTFLGVPINVHGRAVGNLYLTDKIDAPEFTDADQLLVEMFALRAGIAIENARLHQQVQQLAVVEERERIARDLHDGIIQSIYGVALSLEDVSFTVEDDPAEAGVRVDHAIDSLNLIIREIRNFILGLRSELLHGADVAAGLVTLAAEFAIGGSAEVVLDSTAPTSLVTDLPIGYRVQLLQMAREALSNAARHANASRIQLGVHAVEPGFLELRVEDDGIGFDDEAIVAAGHFGLANLRQRSEALGGTMNIATSPGRGTRLRIRFCIY